MLLCGKKLQDEDELVTMPLNCHSLKLHLRKYAHKPDMVLNSDGTPNPLPIIDIYGTRRGPKRKPEESGQS